MGTHQLYQMYDLAAETIAGPIIPSTRDAAVIRQFVDVLADKKTTPGQYPQDYVLLLLGAQNIETGELLTLNKPRTIYTGKQWLKDNAERDRTVDISNQPSNLG